MKSRTSCASLLTRQSGKHGSMVAVERSSGIQLSRQLGLHIHQLSGKRGFRVLVLEVLLVSLGVRHLSLRKTRDQRERKRREGKEGYLADGAHEEQSLLSRLLLVRTSLALLLGRQALGILLLRLDLLLSSSHGSGGVGRRPPEAGKRQERSSLVRGSSRAGERMCRRQVALATPLLLIIIIIASLSPSLLLTTNIPASASLL